MNLTVLHSFPVWLPQTQTWLYHQVRALPETVSSHIVCKEIRNPEQFQLPHTHVLWGASSKMQEVSTRLLRHVDYHVYVQYVSRRLKPDILHSHFGPVAWKNYRISGPRNGIRNHKRHVVTFYGQDVDHLPRTDRQWYQRYQSLFQSIDLVLCEGPFMAQRVTELGCPADRLQVHPLGVDLDAIPFEPRLRNEDEPFRILMAAAFRPKKGLLYGLQALERICEDYPVRITMVGDDTGEAVSRHEKELLLRFIKDSPRLSGKVQLPGFMPAHELQELARSHHIYLAPSVQAEDGDSEGGAPVSLIEMAASGMPVVSSHHCDIPFVIEDGKGGLLAKERDVEGLEQHLRTLLSDPASWTGYSHHARNRIEAHFNAEKQGKRLASLYEMITCKSQDINKLTVSFPEIRKTRPRVLFVSHSSDLMGAERSLADLILGLQSMGDYELRMLAPSEGPLTAMLSENGIKCEIIPYSRWIGSRMRHLAGLLRRIHNRKQLPAILRAISDWDPDLVYSNTIAVPVGAMLTECLPRRPRHIWHARELPDVAGAGFGRYYHGRKSAFDLMVRTSDLFICNSFFLARQLHPLLHDAAMKRYPSGAPLPLPQVAVVPNGFHAPLSTDAKEKGDTGTTHMIMAGSICPRKNMGEAVRALKILHQERKDFQLDIYGTGEERDIRKLQAEIRNAGLGDSVRMAGYHSALETIYGEYDIMLITSRMETFGRVAVEAMLSGCLVISSDSGALSEVVRDGETGLLYPSGDSESLSRTILRVMQNPDYRHQIVSKARDHVLSHYSMKRYITTANRLIDQVLPLNKRNLLTRKEQEADHSSAGPGQKRIAILLSTCNGARYIAEQLESLRQQTYPHWDLWIRDDGSTDETVALVRDFMDRMEKDSEKKELSGNKITLHTGKNIGASASFLELLRQCDEDYAGYAFCDQDDIWLPGKLERAVHWLDSGTDEVSAFADTGVPRLYHCRQIIMDEKGNRTGLSPLPRNTGYRNALVQNQVVGCTMVINARLRDLMTALPAVAEKVVLHDWWAYLLASAYGIVFYDNHPAILFRRHEKTATPVTTSTYRAWSARISAIRNRSWSIHHILKQVRALETLHTIKISDKISKRSRSDDTGNSERLLYPIHAAPVQARWIPDGLRTLKELEERRLPSRIGYFFHGPHRRSHWFETLLFRIMVLLGRY